MKKKTRTKKGEIPQILHHKQKNLAYIIIKGKKYYLGKYGSKEAETKRLRVWADHLSGSLPEEEREREIVKNANIQILVSRFLLDAKTLYQKNDRPTSTLRAYIDSAKLIAKKYGVMPVNKFGPVRLKKIRQKLIDSGKLCRNTINARIGDIVRIFRWGVENELVEPKTWHQLQAIKNLRAGHPGTFDHPQVKQALIEDVLKTIESAHPVLGDMIMVQLLGGMRPQEVRLLRFCDIDTTDDIWIYFPHEHKTEHHDKTRAIPLIPEAQNILNKYQNNDANEYIFSPKKALKIISKIKREKRKSKVQPSQRGRRKGRKARKPIKDHYTRDSYLHAVKRAAARAGVPIWSPNQLRHTRATDVDSSQGIAAAQALLGHSSPEITKVYLDPDVKKKEQIERVKEIARKMI